MIRLIAVVLAMLIASPDLSTAGSLDIKGALERTEDDFKKSDRDRKVQRKKNTAEAARKARERAANRDRSKDVCYQLPAGKDAQTACLGEHVMAIRDDRARYIMLGQCNVLGSDDFSSKLSYACSKGVRGCSLLKGEASYWCQQCGASRRWLAVYSLGHVIQCFK